MMRLGSFILEILRLGVLLVATLFILGGLESLVYEAIVGDVVESWSIAIGNSMIFFVLYRNYFQFKGWYKSEKNQKLHPITTSILMVISLVLIMIPMWIS